MCSPAGIGVGLLTHTSKPAHCARRSSHHCFAACSVNLPWCSGSPPPPKRPACSEYAPSPRMSSAFGAAALLSPAVLWPPAGFSPFAEDEHLPQDFLQDTCTEELQESRPRHGQGNCWLSRPGNLRTGTQLTVGHVAVALSCRCPVDAVGALVLADGGCRTTAKGDESRYADPEADPHPEGLIPSPLRQLRCRRDQRTTTAATRTRVSGVPVPPPRYM
jgi:hypothetical protein